MVRVVSLCSGSDGNSTYIEINNIKMLIDAGKSYRYICDSLKKIDVDISDIDYVFVTHNHSDHVKALGSLLKYSNAKFCTSSKMFESLKDINSYDNLDIFESVYSLGDIKIKAIKSSHDAPESRNYIIEAFDYKISLITDSGYIKQTNFKHFYNSDIFLMESNHDIDLLQNGKYPDYLKRRILSDEGHLSNNQAGFYLSKIIGPNTKDVLLIHLSKDNNAPDVAIDTVSKILKEYSLDFNNIKCARQFELSEVMRID